MKTVKLTYEETVELLKRAVAEKPEGYKYDDCDTSDEMGGCVYFNPDPDLETHPPACIVGQVLAYKGMTYEDVADVNEEIEVTTLFGNGMISGDDRTAKLLLEAQNKQDHNHTWKDSVESAIKATREDIDA